MVLLIRCAGANARSLDAKCLVANPGGASLRWEWVVRGMPKGTHEDQELIRRGVMASPRQSAAIRADPANGVTYLQFDEQPPNTFPTQKLGDGNYRAALEIFRGDVLVASIELYNFIVTRSSLERQVLMTLPLTIVQP